MPEYEVTIRYRVRMSEKSAHAHGLMTGEKIISQLVGEFHSVPYVRCDKPKIVRNG